MKSVVLSGGGSRGCFEAGVLYELFDKIEFDRICGTSVGSLNALILAQCYIDKNPKLLWEVWCDKIKKNKHVYKGTLWRSLFIKTPYNYKPLKKLMKEIFDFKKIKNLHDKEFYITSVDLITGQPSYNDIYKQPEDMIIEIVIASASVPPGFPPVRRPNGKILVDGGIRENVPTKFAIQDKDKDSALIVMCSPIQIEEKKGKYKTITSIASRAIDIMMNEITQNDVKMAMRLNDIISQLGDKASEIECLKDKKVIDISTIYPENLVTKKCLDFKHDELVRGFEKGIQAAKEWWQKRSTKKNRSCINT